jgi:peptidoglycan/LPS O-acetylase OafA/YrhL
MNHVRGLDAIRALCAFWVVMGHFGAPPIGWVVTKASLLGGFATGIYNNLTSGPAAVIVFFVISGFCIHYPQVNTFRLASIPAYALRRYARVGLPLLAALVVAEPLHVHLGLLTKTVVWSLVAELIYYTIYPLLLTARRRQRSWKKSIAVSFLLALTVAASDPGAGDYPSYGIALNWVLGLPCWLLGCELAERVRLSDDPMEFKFSVWHWRILIFVIAATCSVLRFHSPIGYPWTLNFFALLVGFWLYREIIHFRSAQPPSWLEWMGTWSYSLYLGHVLAQPLFQMIRGGPDTSVGDWAFHMVFILAFSYLFYLAVERPAHWTARAFARRMAHGSPRQTSPKTAPP